MNLYMMLDGGRHYLIAARKLSRAMQIAAGLLEDVDSSPQIVDASNARDLCWVVLQEAGTAPGSLNEGPVDGARL
jgi:hypothetical protein